MITIKSKEEIALIKESGHITYMCHQYLKGLIKPGVTTKYLDDEAGKFITSLGGVPSCLGYDGYPGNICVSVNDEVVHGIPNRNRVLQEGDIVSLDAGLIYKGYHSDAARTYGVGKISDEAQKLIDVTKQSFFEGIKYAREGAHLFDISNAIDGYVSPYGYGIVRDLVGHGVGTVLHEDPQIPNFKQWRHGPKLRAGMTFAIEPMINMGTWKVHWLDDNWTVVSDDGSLSAHYENTVLITDGEPEILTLLDE